MPHAPDRDEDAIRDFVESMWTAHSGAVRGRLIGMAKGDRHLAEDLTLEAYARLLRSLRQGKPEPKSPRAWLMLTSKRLFIDHVRLAATRNEETREFLPHTASHGDFEAIERREEADRVLDQMSALPRRIMEMRDYEDMSTKDVAKRLGISGQAVRSIRHKAVRAIRENDVDGRTKP